MSLIKKAKEAAEAKEAAHGGPVVHHKLSRPDSKEDKVRAMRLGTSTSDLKDLAPAFKSADIRAVAAISRSRDEKVERAKLKEAATRKKLKGSTKMVKQAARDAAKAE